jgi:hypothetical protein
MFLFGKNDTQEIETLRRDKQKLQKENNDLVQLKEKLEGEKKNLVKEKEKLEKVKNDIVQQKEKFEGENKDLLKKNKEHENNEITLKKNIDSLNEEKRILTKDKEKLEKVKNELLKEKEKFEGENKDLLSKNKEYENGEISLKKNIDILNEEKKCLIKQLEDQKKEFENSLNISKSNLNNLEKEINILKEKNKELNSKIKILDKIEEKQNLGKNPLDFYDIIVNINSMQNIKNGWEVKINENGKKIIDSKEKNKKLVIGVMGNRNKGKSFLLQAISGEKMQTGTTINTIGLSIKFSEDKFVLLDSEGSESPILGEHTSMLDISRDKLFTEAFLLSYIAKYSNALLLIVGSLTFSEQKLINKISEDIKKLKLKGNSKSLIVIHNLQTFETKEEVEKYIKNTLKNSATFQIEEDITNFSNASNFFCEKSEKSIKHFIYAKEDTEAGEYYNKNTINSIKSLYNIDSNKYVYDYKATIIEHFKEMSELMYDLKEKVDFTLEETTNDNKIINEKKNESNDNKEENDLGEEDSEDNVKEEKLQIKDINSNIYLSKLVLKSEVKLILKKMVIDELGVFSFIKNGFNPDYECYYNKKELVINIECPDGVQLNAKRKRNRNQYGGYLFAIEITGQKVEDKVIEDYTYIKKKDSGDYYALIPFSDDNYTLGEKTEEEPKNGWKTFKFALHKIEDD